MTLSVISRSQKLLEKVNFQVFTMFVVEDINQTNSVRVRAALYVVSTHNKPPHSHLVIVSN